jgi:ATP-dependent DNA ligase
MLATPADDIAAAMARLGTAALEWKVDGARVQVHKAGGDVKVYTRALKDVTASAPEIVEALHGAVGARANPRRRGRSPSPPTARRCRSR